MLWRRSLAWALASSAAGPAAGLRGDMRFQEWYEQYRPDFSRIVRDNCRAEHQAFVDGGPIPGCLSCYVEPLVSCVLRSANESTKANMASAAVVLGLLPTTLSLVGPTTVETGVLSLRRPLLSGIITLGSPAVSPIRAFEYRSPVDMLRHRDAFQTPQAAKGRRAVLASAAEYAVAVAAMLNIGFVSWEVTVRTVCSYSMADAFSVYLWPVLTVVVHATGYVGVRLRMRLLDHDGEPIGLLRALRHESTLSAHQPRAVLRPRTETFRFLFMSWATSTLTVFHIIYGTLIFSSLLFISVRDSIIVMARYLASTLVCRILLMYEISGMRQSVDVPDEMAEMRQTIQALQSRLDG